MKIEDVKPGMKVKIVKNPPAGCWGYNEIGRVLTVKLARWDTHIFCEEFEEGAGSLVIDCVEPFIMTKDDLRTGMRVQYRDDCMRVVVNNCLFDADGSQTNRLSNYGDNLFVLRGDGRTSLTDIMRVWAAPEECEDFFNFEKKGTLLFERQEKTAEELKKEELSAKMDDIKKQLSSLQEEYNKL